MSKNSETTFRARKDVKRLQAPTASLRCCCGNMVEIRFMVKPVMPDERSTVSPISDALILDAPKIKLDAPKIKFQNGLLKDIEYYSQFHKYFNCVIGRKKKLFLRSTDFNSLTPGMKLSNFLMEYLCNILVPSSIQVEILKADRIIENAECVQFSKPKVLLPLVKNDHWVLFIIDIEKKTFSYLNSLPNSGAYFKQNFFQMFKNHIVKYNQKFDEKLPSIDNWKEKRYDIDEQKDFTSCGIYVFNNIRQFVKKGSVSKEIKNVDKYRRKLKLECLKLSDDMTNCCLKCGCEVDNGRLDPDVRCKKCNRRLHHRCIKLNVVSVEYECPLCINY